MVERSNAAPQVFRDFQVNDAMMKQAGPQAIFLHCLPAERGIETVDSVVEAPYSKVSISVYLNDVYPCRA